MLETTKLANARRPTRRPRYEVPLAVAIALVLVGWATRGWTDDAASATLDRDFTRHVRPFLETYCLSCHGAEKQEAKFDLRRFTTAAAVGDDFRHWELVVRRVGDQEMPPEDAPRQPTAAQRDAVLAWSKAFRRREAERTAGDPGPVLARRLSNAEYNHTIRDLTGVDIRPTKEFPVDPANQAGFDNTGESLSMSPALVKKYLDAARVVADHVVLTPDGVVFAPHPAVTDTDRDKYCVRRLIDFYQRHPVQYTDYFLTLWRYRYRAALGNPDGTLEELARDARLSSKYLGLLNGALEPPDGEVGPLALVRDRWRKIPGPDRIDQAAARRHCQETVDLVARLRNEFRYSPPAVSFKGISAGSQTIVLWKNRQQAAHRMSYPGGKIVPGGRSFHFKFEDSGAVTLHFAVTDGSDGGERDFVVWRRGQFTRTDDDAGQRMSLRTVLEKFAPDDAKKLTFGKHPLGRAVDPDAFVLKAPAAVSVTIPAAALFEDDEAVWNFQIDAAIDTDSFGGGAVQVYCDPGRAIVPEAASLTDPAVFIPAGDPANARFEAAFGRFCRLFPDTFAVTERSWGVELSAGGQGRLLSAGFHLMQGYFRDDAPLYELVLSDAEQRELDALWNELNFITLAPVRQYKDFIFFERAEPPRFIGEAEFDFARSEDKDSTSQAKIEQLRVGYLAKARRQGADAAMLQALQDYFAKIAAEIRWCEQTRLAAETRHLQWLVGFTTRAYRRPLSAAEKDEVIDFYRAQRRDEGLSHEDALRDTVVRVLLSPLFCFRINPAEAGAGDQPLGDYALASRLSYFLWASMPDQPLLDRAAAGVLHQPDVLRAETRRMLRDERLRGWATEFGGNWLDFRQFEQHNSVDRDRYPQFTDDLRQAMFEEPVRFLMDMAAGNRSIFDLVDGQHTLVNATLARHYGMPAPSGGSDAWVRVDDARPFGRGGLLPMAVFLTKNSPGLRTSPVKRGYWVVRRLLDEEIPAPPPNVPELPKDEAKLGDLSLPQLLARHRDDKSCAGCHRRFDSIGLAFEGFGPVGERRERDLAGRPIENHAVFPDRSEGTGLDGLREYLRQKRRQDYVESLCRKMLSYGLGRGLLLSDEGTLEAMRRQIAGGDERLGSLIETIVTSPQFLRQRGRDAE